MLKVEHLRKTYRGGIKAVDDVSFTVERGQICGIVGPNGAGKTTTIRMILHIIRPDSGQVTLNSSPLDAGTKHLLGYLPEERGLYKKSTIADTLQYFADLKGVKPAESKPRISYWLERFNLKDMGKRKVEELSKGNQQKVQFIASVLHDPEILIVDEPFSGLDPLNQLLFRDIVLELRKTGKIIVFCTHQLEAAEALCDSLVMMNKGHAALNGPLSSIKARFTRNVYELEYSSGSIQMLREHTGILTVEEKRNGFAVVELAGGNGISSLLPDLSPSFEFTRIQKYTPSLLSIFTEIIGKENLSTDFLEQRPNYQEK
jgi:ABC-2 type transport system ATP-binding protein